MFDRAPIYALRALSDKTFSVYLSLEQGGRFKIQKRDQEGGSRTTWCEDWHKGLLFQFFCWKGHEVIGENPTNNTSTPTPKQNSCF